MHKRWSDSAWRDYISWQGRDAKTLKRINRLLDDIDRNGYNGIGKPEPLRGDKSGYWSVRIDQHNRIVFKITEDGMFISQCGTHYGE